MIFKLTLVSPIHFTYSIRIRFSLPIFNRVVAIVFRNLAVFSFLWYLYYGSPGQARSGKKSKADRMNNTLKIIHNSLF